MSTLHGRLSRSKYAWGAQTPLRPVHEETVHEEMLDAAWGAQTPLRPVHQETVQEGESSRVSCGVQCGSRLESVPQGRVAARVYVGSTHAACNARDVIALRLQSAVAGGWMPWIMGSSCRVQLEAGRYALPSEVCWLQNSVWNARRYGDSDAWGAQTPLRPVHQGTVHEEMLDGAVWGAQTPLRPIHQETVQEEVEGSVVSCGVRCVVVVDQSLVNRSPCRMRENQPGCVWVPRTRPARRATS